MKKFFKHLFGFLSFLTLLGTSFSVGYFIETHLFRLLPFSPHDYFRYLIAMVLGFFIMAGIGYLISLFTHNRRTKPFQEVIDALRKISKGDFDVHLDLRGNKDHPYTKLIAQINHAAKQLKQMEDMRQEFISNVSHEIQSPLTSISGFARALQYDQLSKEDRIHYLGIIETESKRLSKLSDNLLKLTALESVDHPVDRRTYRLDQQIRHIILACEPQWVEKEIEMDVSLEKMIITADEDLLSQVWMNLISNSIKFTPDSGEIRVSIKGQEDRIIVEIADSGIGISKKDQVHIFERFFKVDKARERSKGGSGLGLSIVKKIVEMHNGTIYVESEIGKGTMFQVELPIH